MAILQKPKPLTNEEKLQQQRQQRQQELDYFAAMEAQRKEQEALQRADRDAFVARAQKTREEFAKAKELGLQWVPDTPLLHVREVWADIRAAELQAKADAEAANIVSPAGQGVPGQRVRLTDPGMWKTGRPVPGE